MNSCPEYEDRIIEWHASQLEAGAAGEVKTHLGHCAACREYAQRLELLDAALSARYHPVSLPPTFQAELLRRIDAATAFATAEAEATQRAALAAELQVILTRLRQNVVRFWLTGLLNAIGLAALIGIAAAMFLKISGGASGLTSEVQTILHQETTLHLLWGLAAATTAGAMWLGMDRGRRQPG